MNKEQIEAQRVLFEAAARDEKYNLCRSHGRPDDYAFPSANGAWWAWLASATASARMVGDLRASLRWALEWIDAVPQDVQLPAMPGFDRDYVNDLLAGHATASEGRIAELEAALRKISETRFGWDGDCGVVRIAEDALDSTAALAGSATPSVAPAAQAEAVAMDAVAKFAELMISEFFTGPKYKATRYDIRGLAKDFKPKYWDVAGTKAADVVPQDTLKNADSDWIEFRTNPLPVSDGTAYLVMLKPDNDSGYVSDYPLMAWYGMFKAHPNDWTIDDGNMDNGFCVITPDVTHYMPLPDQPVRTAAIESERATLKEGKA